MVGAARLRNQDDVEYPGCKLCHTRWSHMGCMALLKAPDYKEFYLMDDFGDQYHQAQARAAGTPEDAPVAHDSALNLAACNPVYHLICFQCAGRNMSTGPDAFLDSTKALGTHHLVLRRDWQRK